MIFRSDVVNCSSKSEKKNVFQFIANIKPCIYTHWLVLVFDILNLKFLKEYIVFKSVLSNHHIFQFLFKQVRSAKPEPKPYK